MTPQEEVMDDLERELQKVVIKARHAMYVKMSGGIDAPKNTANKYLLRYQVGKAMKTKAFKPEFGKPIIEKAIEFMTSLEDKDINPEFRIFDSQLNLIYKS